MGERKTALVTGASRGIAEQLQSDLQRMDAMLRLSMPETRKRQRKPAA